MQRRGVVDAVSHEADDGAFVLKGANDPLLMFRRETRENPGAFSGFGEFGIRSCTVLWRIEEGNVTLKDQVAFVLFGNVLVLAKMIVGDCKHTESVSAELLIVLP